MQLSEKQLTENYEKLIDIIKNNISGERKNKLLDLYDKLSDRIITAPASSTNTFHGCFPGGYVLHVLGVVECAIDIYNLWESKGADMSGYTLEDLIFCAINHDLGKIGNMELDYYIPNTSEWHVKNQGKVYNYNPELNNMSVPDRSIWLLQNAGILLSENEFLAIKLHDGPYVDENKPYFSAYQDEKKFKSNIVLILHHADYTSYRIEYEKERLERGNHTVPKKVLSSNQTKKPALSDSSKSANELFSLLFKKEEK